MECALVNTTHTHRVQSCCCGGLQLAKENLTEEKPSFLYCFVHATGRRRLVSTSVGLSREGARTRIHIMYPWIFDHLYTAPLKCSLPPSNHSRVLFIPSLPLFPLKDDDSGKTWILNAAHRADDWSSWCAERRVARWRGGENNRF